ncbi:MAG TPA: two-component regulator propeller domain-containing protein [Tahibacter sp.]|uniref:two-component regulator propeller domain-containing protein n=1 Tax=Tahibacter sp. TaxID=2056211 RepID=UPI002C788534|nr:two-component regulator propeller domain-containing protein [Tahibacter sp.]HSX60746.1 two-component regulator propeller domain-containing protein [Tahibacter sp.]
MTQWLFALALLALQTLACASDQRPLNEYFRETWTTRQGLPHNLVQGVAQTPDGYLWFATWEGVARYNGIEFRAFDRANVPALADNGIRALQVMRDGTLVLGTSRGGVTRLRDGVWSRLDMRDGLAQDEIMDVLEDASGRLWVATESAGLDRVDGRAVRHFGREQGLPSLSLFLLNLAADGSIWAGTTEGLVRVRDDVVEAFGEAHGLPPGPVFDIAFDGDAVYVGTERGVYRRDGERFVAAAANLPVDAVQRLLVDRAGHLWIGTVNHGVLRLRDGRVEALSSEVGLPNNRVSALFEDREGSIWVGTNGGLLRLRDAPFVSYTTEHGLADNYVRSVLQTADGTLWAGTSRGLSRWNGQHFEAMEAAADVFGDSVLSLAGDGADGLWVGTYANGLVHWRPRQPLQRFSASDGLAGNQVRAIATARDGAVWVGTARGLSRLRDGAWRSFTLADGLPREFIIALHAAADGRLWIGTANGAAVADGDTIRSIDLSALDGIEDVFGFHEDADGTIWMATDRGLVRARGDRYTAVARRHGLPVDTVFQVVADQENRFWLTTNRGVLRIARGDADAVADGRVSQLAVDVYGEADGMASAQCNGGSGPAAWRSSDGRIWVATAMGLSSVDPPRLPRFARSAPPVVVEEVRVDDRAVTLKDGLHLAPGTRKIELHFAGLSYLMPQKIRYRYRLDGFDPDWVERGTQRFAQFTNLAPGDYRFRVSAANAGGDWNGEEAVVDLYVAPRLWQRSSFWAATALAGIAVLYLVYAARVRQLHRNERRLRELIDQRTQDLRAQTERLTAADAEKSALLVRLREHADAFERQAREDSLTGLANRRWFDEQLAVEFEHAVRESRPLTLALVDIDHFKRINDKYSHAAGDAALRLVADTMRAQLRAEDRIARYGGEEFALLFADTTVEQARTLAERLRIAVESTDCSAFAPGLTITVSVGLATRGEETHHERLVSQADARLYEAKRGGRNRVCG